MNYRWTNYQELAANQALDHVRAHDGMQGVIREINLRKSVDVLERMFAPMRERQRTSDLAALGVREIYPERP